MPKPAVVPLSKLCDAARRITYGIVQPGKLHSGGVPIVRVNNFRGHRVDLTDRLFVSPEKEKNYGRSRPRPNDVMISLVGSIGQVAIAPPEIKGWNLARAVGLLPVSDRDDARWIFYSLQTPGAQQFIRQYANTTVQATFNLKDLAALPIFYPAKREREAVLEVLGSLDDKIELNRRMNETLEAMAQAIFRDWFVDFEPTRRQMAGATDPVQIMGGLTPDPEKAAILAPLFPPTLADDGLPQGWEAKPLDEIADFLNGLALQKFPVTNPSDSLPVVKIAELRNGLTGNTSRASREVPAKYVIQDGDFLFSWSGSLLAKFWTGGEGALNQHLFKVTSANYPAWFYTRWVHHHLEEFQRIAASKATTMGHIQRSHLKAAVTTCPPIGEIERMGDVLAPIVEMTIQNALQNRTLAATRDLLLPRLMSGQQRLSET